MEFKFKKAGAHETVWSALVIMWSAGYAASPGINKLISHHPGFAMAILGAVSPLSWLMTKFCFWVIKKNSTNIVGAVPEHRDPDRPMHFTFGMRSDEKTMKWKS